MIRGLLKTATLAQAAFTVLVVIARFARLPFTIVVFGACTIGIVAISYGVRRWRQGRSSVGISVVQSIMLGAIVCAVALVTCAINAPEEDDSLYVPAAMQSVAAPERPMGFDLDWIAPFDGCTPIRSEIALVCNAGDMLWAVASHLTGIQYLRLYHVAGTILFAALFVVINFDLLCRFRPPSASIVGVLAIATAALLFFRPNGLGFGIALNKIWLGKSILLAVMVPLVGGFAIDYVRKPTIRGWVWVAIAATAASGFSSSGLFIVPALLAAVAPAVLLSPGDDALGLRFWRAFSLPFAAFFPAVVAAFLKTLYGSQLNDLGKTPSSTSLALFRSGFDPWFGSPWSLTTIAVVSAVVYLAVRSRAGDAPLLCWFGAAVALFTNPLTSGPVAEHLTSALAYNRIFHVIPVYALAGVAVSDIVDRWPRYKAGTAALIIASAGGYALFLGQAKLAAQLDVPKAAIIGSPHFGRPLVRVDEGLLNDVREIERLLPAGNTLASVDYALTIPMLTMKLPQYYLWPMSVMPFYGQVQGFEREADQRYGAARFLIGEAQFKDAFEGILDTPVRNVVLSKRIGGEIGASRLIVERHGFVFVAESSRYVLYTKQPRSSTAPPSSNESGLIGLGVTERRR